MEVTNCKYCNVVDSLDQLDLFDDTEVERILNGVYNGDISITNLDEPTYTRIAEKLTSGVYKGFGMNIGSSEFGSPDRDMLNSLRENTYIFSAAKTYQQTKEISALLTNEKGLVPYSEFKKEASRVFDTYNKHYLTAEYNSAIAQARSASMWLDFEKQKDVYNQLTYQTVGDGRVRFEHRVLDGITRPLDDKFWSIYMPPNGWNCRCSVLQSDASVSTDLSTKTPPTKKEVPEIFRFNAGKEKIIFSKHHPYFEVAKSERELALNNFNLPLPKKEVEVVPVKGFIPAKTTLEAEQRLLSAGVGKVSLKGLKPDLANGVLEAVERESGFGNFSLNEIGTFRSSGKQGIAYYSPSSNRILINLAHLKSEKQILLSYEEQLIENKEMLKKFGMEYLGKPQYKQSTVNARMNSFRNRIWDLESKIKNGETARYWTVSSTYENPSEALKAVTTHELGHYRHYKTLGETYAYNFNKATSITEYGRTNEKEYLAEWFAQYRMKGEAGVPEDMIRLFKIIDNGK